MNGDAFFVHDPEMSKDAFEILGDSGNPGPFLFTCEHASNAVPESVVVSASDRKLLGEHWGWDIGAQDVVATLVSRFGGQAVVTRFSRLWIDPNRAPESASLIVSEIDGEAVSFNESVDAHERERRIRQYFDPYHGAVHRTGSERAKLASPFEVLSVHSFTPLYLGKRRAMEVGVLFNEHDEDAWHMQEALSAQGFESALNAPYSGKPPEALIYAAQRHGQTLGVKYLELEIRQDLIDTKDKARDVGDRIANALERYLELTTS